MLKTIMALFCIPHIAVHYIEVHERILGQGVSQLVTYCSIHTHIIDSSFQFIIDSKPII